MTFEYYIGHENINLRTVHHCRYRDRYWRESSFRGMELVRKTLEEVYGSDNVSMVSATFRWLNHHSAMKLEYNGEFSCSSLFCDLP